MKADSKFITLRLSQVKQDESFWGMKAAVRFSLLDAGRVGSLSDCPLFAAYMAIDFDGIALLFSSSSPSINATHLSSNTSLQPDSDVV